MGRLISIQCKQFFLFSVYQAVFSGLYFPAFGLNMERYFIYFLSLCIQSKCGKIWTRKKHRLYLDTFHRVSILIKLPEVYCQIDKHSQKGKALVKTNAGYFKSVASDMKLQESKEYLVL